MSLEGKGKDPFSASICKLHDVFVSSTEQLDFAIECDRGGLFEGSESAAHWLGRRCGVSSG